MQNKLNTHTHTQVMHVCTFCLDLALLFPSTLVSWQWIINTFLHRSVTRTIYYRPHWQLWLDTVHSFTDSWKATCSRARAHTHTHWSYAQYTDRLVGKSHLEHTNTHMDDRVGCPPDAAFFWNVQKMQNMVKRLHVVQQQHKVLQSFAIWG